MQPGDLSWKIATPVTLSILTWLIIISRYRYGGEINHVRRSRWWLKSHLYRLYFQETLPFSLTSMAR
jgi:hypothetical protein